MHKLKTHFAKWRTLEANGNLLTELRHQNKLYRKDLAKKTGTHQNSIGKYERGEVDPPLSVAVKILDALGYDVCLVKRSDQWNSGCKYVRL